MLYEVITVRAAEAAAAAAYANPRAAGCAEIEALLRAAWRGDDPASGVGAKTCGGPPG